MTATFNSLKDTVLRLVKDSIKLRAIPKEDFRKLIEDQIKTHKNFMTSSDALSGQERKQFFDRYSAAIAATKLPSSDVHLKYRNMLQGAAKSAEQKAFLASLTEASKTMVKVEEEILKNLDKFFDSDTDTVSLFNTKMSTVMLLGVLRKSDELAKFNSFLWQQLILLANNPEATMPKYRTVFLVDHVGDVAETVNNLLNKEGLFYILRDVDSMKKNQSDMILAVNGSPSFMSFLTNNRFSKLQMGLILHGIPALNFFRWAGEKWDNYVMTRYRYMEQDKTWMENRVALLKLMLADISPDDPKYREQLKIIEAYDDMITDLDRKLTAYQESD